MKVALAHHWLNRPRGGERVLAQLARIFPDAPIFTSIFDSEADWPPELSGPARERIRPTPLQWIYRLDRRTLPLLAPLMPAAGRTVTKHLRGLETLLISDAGVAKCIPVPRGTQKLVYLHTPMRRLWLEEGGVRRELPSLLGAIADVAARRLRERDLEAAETVDSWAANSATTRARLAQIYRIAPEKVRVIHPAVPWAHATEETAPVGNGPRQGLLVVSPLVLYKRDDLAVLAASRLGASLTVVGDGPERSRLEALGATGVRFVGRVGDIALRGLYRSAAGLLFCGEEDCGLVPLEAMWEGCPVLAYRAGGVVETIREGIGGLFFDEPEVESVIDGILRLRAHTWDPGAIRTSVARFTPETLEREVREWIRSRDGCARTPGAEGSAASP